MLVLSRKPGEKIVIDGQVRLTVLEVHGGQVRLGVEAPEAVRVLRDELVKAPASESECKKHVFVSTNGTTNDR
jgi:carbon storage regulator